MNGTSQKVRVALVDDNEMFRTVLKKVLAKGKNITVVAEISSAKEPLFTLKKKRPELILLDVRLGKVNSLYWTEKIKKSLPESIIFVLTSYDYPLYKEMARESRIPEYILKKDVAKILNATIRKYFKKASDKKTKGGATTVNTQLI